MNSNHLLAITWAKAFDEVYCHHASLFIPYPKDSGIYPEIIKIGFSLRTNIIEKKKIVSFYDIRKDFYLMPQAVDEGLTINLNSTPIVEALALNLWTTVKDNKRGSLKEFPTYLFYQIDDMEEVSLPFSQIKGGTPYLYSESNFAEMNNGDMIDVKIPLESNV